MDGCSDNKDNKWSGNKDIEIKATALEKKAKLKESSTFKLAYEGRKWE